MNTLADSMPSWKANLATMATPEQALTLRADINAFYEAGYRDGSTNYELEHCPACKNVADLQAALDENAKLRELVALQMVIDKHMSLCATTDCGQCPVRDECGESVYLEGLLGIDPKGLSWRVQERMAETTDVQAENAKLRKLLMMAYKAATEPDCADCYNEHSCKNNGLSYCVMWVELEQKMRDELGVEVSDA